MLLSILYLFNFTGVYHSFYDEYWFLFKFRGRFFLACDWLNIFGRVMFSELSLQRHFRANHEALIRARPFGSLLPRPSPPFCHVT